MATVLVNAIYADASYSTIGGGLGNAIQTNAAYSTIGGGTLNAIQTDASDSTIGGGRGNTIRSGSGSTTIGGGDNNTIETNAYSTTVSGGNGNIIQFNAAGSTIGGGSANAIQPNAASSMIGGGNGNVIQTNASGSTIGGGIENTIQPHAGSSTIGGGVWNTIQPHAGSSTIGGGAGNIIAGTFAVVPGGRKNAATADFSFAAGHRAKAGHSGSFVWADAFDVFQHELESTNANSVTMRASGGYRLFTDTNATAGAFLAAGSGSWTSMSDRNAKENFAPVDSQAVLAKVAALQMSIWNYKSQDTSIRHIGPMAQDFKSAFGVGESSTGISTVDADGVALAAIQGLNQKLEETRAENAELKQRLAELERVVQRLAVGAPVSDPAR